MYPELLPPLLILLGASLGLVTFLVLRGPVIRRLAARQIRRRVSESVLVVLGSVLGTTLIVASLVVGDSLDRSVRQTAYDVLGPIDEVVRTPSLALGDEASRRLEAIRERPGGRRTAHGTWGAGGRIGRHRGRTQGLSAHAGVGPRPGCRGPVRRPALVGTRRPGPWAGPGRGQQQPGPRPRCRRCRAGHGLPVRRAAEASRERRGAGQRARRDGCRGEHQQGRVRVAGHPDGSRACCRARADDIDPGLQPRWGRGRCRPDDVRDREDPRGARQVWTPVA